MDEFLSSRPGNSPTRPWGPLLVALVLGALVTVLWWSLEQREQNTLRDRIRDEVFFHVSHLESELGSRIPSLQRMAWRWEMRGGTPREEFLADAGSYVEDLPGFQALAWVDEGFVIRWVVPQTTNEKIANLSLAFEDLRRQALEQARTSRTLVMTPPLDLVRGGKGFLILFPLEVRGKFDGVLLAVVRYGEWLDHVFNITDHHPMPEHFRAQVLVDGERVYRQEGWTELGEASWGAESAVNLLGHHFIVQVRPTPAYFAAHRTVLPRIVAWSGFLLATLVGLIVLLLQNISQSAQKLRRAKTSLEEEMRQREGAQIALQSAVSRLDLATQAGGIGVWTQDLETRDLSWNDQMFSLFGIPSEEPPSVEAWRRTIDPEDRASLDRLRGDAVAKVGSFHTEIRISHPGGGVRHLGIAARMERNAGGASGALIGVCWDLTALKETEHRLRRQADMQKILMDVSSRCINIPLDEVPQAIQNALGRMGAFVGADRAYVFEYDFSRQTVPNTYTWCAPDVPCPISELRNLALEDFSSWVATHRQGEAVTVTDVGTLPPGEWRRHLESRHIGSLIAIPMLSGDDLRGFVGFESPERRTSYADQDLALFGLFTQIIVSIQRRTQAEMALRQSEEQVRLLLNSTAEAIFGVDLDGRCTFANPSCLRMLGYNTVEDLLGENMHTRTRHAAQGGEPLSEEACRIHQTFSQGAEVHVEEETFGRSDGSLFPVEYWSYPQWVEGRVVGAVVTFLDISERKQAAEALARERQRLAHILESTNAGTWEWHVPTGEVVFNERWAEMVGYTLEDLAPSSIATWGELGHPDDLRRSNELLEKHFQKEVPYYESEMRLRHRDGRWIWVLDRGKVVSWTAEGSPLRMFGTHQDITERKVAEERIRHLANHDALTDLPNLLLARDRLAMALGAARRHHHRVAVMFVDLDGFKGVNDTFGHDAGDEVLRSVARSLRSCLRETDTAARVGGDEFLLVVRELGMPEHAAIIAEKVLRALAPPIPVPGGEATVGASVGIALYPDHGTDDETLIKEADDAMYRVKSAGKNGYRFAESSKG